MPERAPIPGQLARPHPSIQQGRKEGVTLPVTFGRESIGVPAGKFIPDAKYRRVLAFAQQPGTTPTLDISATVVNQPMPERSFIPFKTSTDTEKMLMNTTSNKAQIQEALTRLHEQNAMPEEIKEILQGKYEKVGHILDAVEAILLLDQETEPELKNIIIEKLTPLATVYGFRIVQGDYPLQDVAYAERIGQHLQAYRGAHIPEEYLSFTSINGKQLPKQNDLFWDTTPVKPEGILKDDPVVQSYTTAFNQLSEIQKYVPSKPGGTLDLPSSERASEKIKFNSEIATKKLLYIGKSILWEGVNGNVFDLSMYLTYINQILSTFGVHIDVEQPNQTQQNSPQQQASQ